MASYTNSALHWLRNSILIYRRKRPFNCTITIKSVPALKALSILSFSVTAKPLAQSRRRRHGDTTQLKLLTKMRSSRLISITSLQLLQIVFPLIYTENSSYKGLLGFHEKSKSALAMKSVQFGFAATNMVSKFALSRRLFHSVLVLYEHTVATLILMLFTYILDRLERIGIISLAGEVKVLGAIICMGGAAVMKLCEEITLNLWSSPLLIKEGNASTDDNDSNTEILVKGSVSFVSIFRGFILQLSRPLMYLLSQQKRPIFLGLKLGKSREGIALLLMMNIAVASTVAAVTIDNTETISTAGEDIPIGDKLPPSCYYVLKCGECFPCPPKGQGFLCCDES